ncbi:TPA: helix-turn-helix domain-containing protein [Escherichia coli]|uniref:Transcriptional regulator n=1 Tax=Escherichia coli TaxID=562 RepID=A0A1Q4PBQ8_ECOLX|nr:helix-turn-helix transcriptional regulator [Escherichia coli]HDQ6537487.1 helix-turn-helix domain-containing protein [Escherichia coli O146:H28]EEC8140513.1 transcriptional regulator [Escherichia coli]EEG9494935.1 transcriptional regulator [Escherichia coli]EEQ2502522.1 transcriptional regulator [Escherichia coli]EEQ4452362.1 transcriptional regulator [Escherichia coli]
MTKKDWHPADIIAALHKRGTSLAKLSREAGLASSTLANALNRPWPKGEWLIAIALGKHPSEIWPERYLNTGNKREPRKPLHLMTTTENSGT